MPMVPRILGGDSDAILCDAVRLGTDESAGDVFGSLDLRVGDCRHPLGSRAQRNLGIASRSEKNARRSSGEFYLAVEGKDRRWNICTCHPVRSLHGSLILTNGDLSRPESSGIHRACRAGSAGPCQSRAVLCTPDGKRRGEPSGYGNRTAPGGNRDTRQSR